MWSEITIEDDEMSWWAYSWSRSQEKRAFQVDFRNIGPFPKRT